MSDARLAIRAARDAGAEQVVPRTLREAEQALARAVASIEQGDYRVARRDAEAAHANALRAGEVSRGVTALAEAIRDAEGGGRDLGAARAALAEARSAASAGEDAAALAALERGRAALR
ncbi:MAG: DUF4398 domain-containing protein [Ectothiorhodospiraceae bacterium]|nr:DUF4398 domain-containing protein [Chromatiales bacterium]MCP5157136.1 DUF4398 domain-containing protein [Ectothiorhodospiraceae bacterium]